jgi:predicted RNA-binding Zn ribbon-like protein
MLLRMTKPPRYDVPKAAPAPLRIVQELVNTTDHEFGRELLPTAAALTAWLAEHRLPAAHATSDDLRRTHVLREALRALLVANAGERLHDGAVERLNEIAATAEVTLRFSANGSAGLAPQGRGVSAAHGRILAIVHGAMTDGTWPRLKACRQCAWAFYDFSKNRSATWCSMQLCGNRLKTRAYRARRRPARA